MRLVPAGCKPRKQERHTNSKKHRAALTMRTRPGKSGTGPNMPVSFWWFLYEIELSLQFGAHFADVIFQKCSTAVSFYSLICKSSPRYSPVHFLPTTFSDRGLEPQKQRPHFSDPRSHVTIKIPRFRAWDCLHPWIHTFPKWYTSQVLDNGWLTWWCDWHDAGNANHDNRIIVRNLEVFQQNFLW